MFEQSVIVENRRPWSIAASFTLQIAFAAALVILSILHVDRLPVVSLPAALPPLPTAPPVVEIVHTSVVTAGARKSSILTLPRLTQPSHMPEGIPAIFDDTPAVPIAFGTGSHHTGVPGGIGIVPNQIAPPPPAPEPTTVEPVKETPIAVGGVVMEAKLIKRVMPVYPQLARQARISGTVRLLGVVSREGTVKSLQVESGHPLLAAAAVEAVRQWLYSPTLLNGKPVEVIAPIQVHFTLNH